MKLILMIVLSVGLSGCLPNEGAVQNGADKPTLEFQNSSGGGNGDYYGGKPEPGTYSRVASFSSCSASCLCNPLISEKIQISETSATLSKRDPTTCKVMRQEIDFNELEYAAYEPGRVGHSEGIYVKSGVLQSQGINEAWCRLEGSNTRTGYDVIVTANYDKREFASKVTDSKLLRNGETVRREFHVDSLERDIQPDSRIRYRSDDFVLEVDLTKFNAVTGKFSSKVKFEASGIDLETSIGCRLSGELETAN